MIDEVSAPTPGPPKTAMRNWAWGVCWLMFACTALNYMDRQALAVTLPELKRDYNLQEKRIGLIEGCFGFAFAAGSVLFGCLADRLGPRRLYPLVLTGWSLAGIATGFATALPADTPFISIDLRGASR